MKTATKSPTKKATKKVAKKVTKKTTKKETQLITKWNPKEKLTLSEELFCLYYVKNEETRRNGTMSYNLAFDKGLEDQDKEDAIWDVDDKGVKTKLIQASSYERCHRVCSTLSSKLLTKVNISTRITELLNEMLTNEIVDGELTKVILQDRDYNPKVRAIQEFNKLRKRTVDTVEHHHSFAKYEGMSDDELEKALKDGEKFFKKG